MGSGKEKLRERLQDNKRKKQKKGRRVEHRTFNIEHRIKEILNIGKAERPTFNAQRRIEEIQNSQEEIEQKIANKKRKKRELGTTKYTNDTKKRKENTEI